MGAIDRDDLPRKGSVGLAGALAAVFFIAAAVSAGHPRFVVLEPLPGWEHASALSISGDGQTIVGYSGRHGAWVSSVRTPTLWRRDGRAEAVEPVPGASSCDIADISSDGTTFLMTSYFPGTDREYRLHLYRRESGFQEIGASIQDCGGNFGQRLSDTGSLAAIAECQYTGFEVGRHSLLVDRLNGEFPIVAAQNPVLGTTNVFGISGDGRVVLGQFRESATEPIQAFAWTVAEGARALRGPDGYDWVWAQMASRDGSILFGAAHRSGASRLIRWTTADTWEFLPVPKYTTPFPDSSFHPNGVNDDGTVVVGTLNPRRERLHPVVWMDRLGSFSLEAMLAQSAAWLPGFVSTNGIDVSGDGRTFIGWGYYDDFSAGGSKSWVASLDPVCEGDVNLDGVVDDGDFRQFVRAYRARCQSTNFGDIGWWCRFDFDLDGVISDEDFTIFAQRYDQLLCD